MWIRSNWSAGQLVGQHVVARTSRFGWASSRSWVMSRSVASTLPGRPLVSQRRDRAAAGAHLEAVPSGLDEARARIVPASSSASSVRSRSRWAGIAFSNAYSLMPSERTARRWTASRATDRRLAAMRSARIRSADDRAPRRPRRIAVLACRPPPRPVRPRSNGTTITYQSADAGENVDVGVDGSGPVRLLGSSHRAPAAGAPSWTPTARTARQRVRGAAVRTARARSTDAR